MTDQEYEEQTHPEAPADEQDLQAEQEGKGFGEDEGEREDALPPD